MRIFASVKLKRVAQLYKHCKFFMAKSLREKADSLLEYSNDEVAAFVIGGEFVLEELEKKMSSDNLYNMKWLRDFIRELKGV